jgi:aspartokinase/homoserine dehydrogenase 1
LTRAVHKFGGTSLADAAGYRRAGAILAAEEPRPQAVVVSAMAGVTDGLLDLVGRASSRDPAYTAAVARLFAQQVQAIDDLLPPERREPLAAALQQDFDDLRDLLRALWLMQAPPKNATDVVSGYGELWSARLLAAHLQAEGIDAAWLDAREVLIVGPGELSPVVDWEASRARLDAWRARNEPRGLVVITGFVAADERGAPTTLGRNGSDYSASIFARLLQAGSITIWTDVSGVLSADPRLVPEAQVLAELSYDEAMELAYFGAKVIHPGTMAPAVSTGIEIRIRNTFDPRAPGTRIHDAVPSETAVRGFATIGNMILFNLEGTGMIGVPGIAERLFGTLREAGISVVMISQGSSEHSICFAIPAAQLAAARAAVERTFVFELRHGQIQKLEVTDGCTILAVVGDGMAGKPGVAANLFGALGRAGINVRAIAQGSSERNISVVIDSHESTRALRAVHAGFYLSEQTLSIGLVGPGTVGRTLLAQIDRQLERLRREFHVDLRVRAIANSSRMLLDDRQIPLGDWSVRLASHGSELDLDGLAAHVRTDSIPHWAIVDCTASAEVAARYAGWLASGLHVITPNKKAGTASLAAFRELERAARSARRHYLYETTVGAALPILQTLRDLIQTGDEVLSIEGILSGTLSYLFNNFDGSRPFSEIVREARVRGFTEPDPREDLSGMDVARKVVILGREMGLDLELDDVAVEGLVPDELRDGEVEAFLDRLDALDEPVRRRFAEARAHGEVLRYVGVVEPASASTVRLRSYPDAHPFSRVRMTDNVVQFRTRRYHDNPLVVQGPGAGPEVTAAGVFADLLRLASYLGARR